jgi:hypothetical protein
MDSLRIRFMEGHEAPSVFCLIGWHWTRAEGVPLLDGAVTSMDVQLARFPARNLFCVFDRVSLCWEHAACPGVMRRDIQPVRVRLFSGWFLNLDSASPVLPAATGESLAR